MTDSKFQTFVQDTNNLMGEGSVVDSKIVKGVYIQFEMSSESKAVRLLGLWQKAFTKLRVRREGRTVTAA